MPGGWHLERSVSVGHIISTLMVAVAGVAFIWDIKIDVAQNKAAIETASEAAKVTSKWSDVRIANQEARFNRALDKIERALQRIEDKLDQKADKR